MSQKDKNNTCDKGECQNKKDQNAQDNHSHCGCDSAEGAVLQDEVKLDSSDQMVAEEQNLNLTELLLNLEKATAEAEKNRDLYLRSVADLDTYRRKVQREKEELAKFAVAPLIEELLPSMDHLEMAIAAAKAANEAPSLTMGVEMVCAQIAKVFEAVGVKEVDAQGKVFDPKFEDCVAHEPSEDFPENTVSKVMRKGYILNGRLLRPASVIVSSGAPKEKK